MSMLAGRANRLVTELDCYLQCDSQDAMPLGGMRDTKGLKHRSGFALFCETLCSRSNLLQPADWYEYCSVSV